MYQWLLLGLHLVIMTLAVVHALIYKRDHRAALGWIGFVVIFPIAGPLLYFIFGINRIRSVARRFSGHYLPFLNFGYERTERPYIEHAVDKQTTLPDLIKVGTRVTGATLSYRNHITMLINGEAFFPELLNAIASSQKYILVSTYLFGKKGIGGEVIAALGAAVARGVKVYTLVDSTGTLYSLRGALRPLRKQGVRVAEFMPLSILPPSFGINLRNHRKIVVIDGHTAYFGGINIDHRHMVEDPSNKQPTQDLHFLARGPVVTDLQNVFIRDWWIASRERLEFDPIANEATGTVCCRVIDDGPDENLDSLALTLQGVISAARHSITLMTPYFLPTRELIASLQSASIRGVNVRILLPARSNLRVVDWATRNLLWELLIWNVQIFYVRPPFAHSKLLVIDDCYVMGGSANIDPRSLRLNFELGVEMLDADLASSSLNYLDQHIASARRVTIAELDGRPIWQRIRDAFFWLFSSYL